MWYSAGTVSVTVNSATVTGTGTAFSANARTGDAFRGPDGRWYEITNIASATVLSIRPNYQGATASGQAYTIAPMQGYVKESADRLRQITDQFGTILADLGENGPSIKVDAAGLLADRAAYDGRSAGFAYYATDTELLYIKLGGAADAWSLGAPVAVGPPGPTGDVTPEALQAMQDAQAAAAAASESASTASQAVSSVQASAQSAADSASAADSSASGALASEQKAEQWAENTEDLPVEPGQFSAKHYAIKAGASAASASVSATNAANSATAAAASEASAETANTAAQAAKTAAESSATNAVASATNAAASATTASTKATEASASATTATTKASEASTSATSASTSATKAGQWADANENIAVETGKYSAKHHAIKAGASAASAAGSASAAAASATNASGSADSAASSAGSASQSATDAAASAGVAATKAGESASSASTAEQHSLAAQQAADAVAAIGAGWTPVLAVVADGERRVLQVIDWTGGEANKPAIWQYIGVGGFVADIAQAADIRGAAGSGSVESVAGALPDANGNVDLSPADIGAPSETALKQASPSILIVDQLRRSVEAATGGRQTVLYTAKGQPSHMYVLPRFNCEDIAPGGELGTGTHPAFLFDGVAAQEIFVGAHLASEVAGEAVSRPFADPRTSLNFDQSRAMCQANGPGWDLMSNLDWAAIALWCMANGYEPLGNTNWGRHHTKRWETGRRVDTLPPGEATGVGRTLAGSGPASWAHDGTPAGIQDLVGNVWEWVSGMKMINGRAWLAPDNGRLTESQFVDSGFDMPTTRVFSTASATGASALVKQSLIAPASASLAPQGYLYTDLTAERLPLRGGSRSHSSNSGLGALHLNFARTLAGGWLGFRSRFRAL